MNLKNISNNMAIQCDTEEKARLLLTALIKCGYKWAYGEDVTHWETYEDETCYFIKNDEIMYHARASLKNLAFYRNIHSIISFDDIMLDVSESEKSYEDGCQDMHKALQFIYYEAECNEVKSEKFISCFGRDASFERILVEYPGIKLIERLAEFDARKETE